MRKRVAFVLAVLMMILPTALAGATVVEAGNTKPIAFIQSTFECGCKRTGAGALIARNGLITAAHNLVCSDHNKKFKNCVIYFSLDGNTYSSKYTGGFSYHWYADFSHGYESKDDIAYVIFDENVSKRTGYYEYGYLSYEDDSIGWERCTIYGYSGKKLVSDRAFMKFANSKQICWKMSSGFSHCMGGGPVLWGDNFAFLAAVYTSLSGTTGYARILTGDIIQDMIRDGADFGQD